MDKTMPTHTPMRPRTLAELLPGIQALLSKDAVAMLSTKKQPMPSIHQTRTTFKHIKPMTVAEIMALQGPTPRKPQQTTTKSKPWNSSVKVDKTKSLTRDGQMKNSTARKGLNFQPKQNAAANIRATMVPAVSRKSIYPQDKSKASSDDVSRISGVYRIPETPVIRKPKQISNLPYRMKHVSFDLNGDDSFIQREKEINDFENKCDALTEEPTLEKIAEISPPTSTPFKDHRNFRDTFDHSDTDNSILWNNNTIMSFDKTSEDKDTKREESVIVSLCEMLNKATVTNSNNNKNQDLSYLESQAENNLKMINNVKQMLNILEEKQLESLQHIRKLIHERCQTNATTGNNNTIKSIEIEPENVNMKIKEEKFSTENSPCASRPTVIKSKSPSYKIPRKSLCLRKKVFHKSVPNVSDNVKSPNKNSDKALNMYMQIKEQITFLKTPLKKTHSEIQDTPARISHNLQKQLDKLYN